MITFCWIVSFLKIRTMLIQLHVPGAPSVWCKVAASVPKGTQSAQEMTCDLLLPMPHGVNPCCNIYHSTSHGHQITYRLWLASTRWFQTSAFEEFFCCWFWGFLSPLELYQNSLPLSQTTRPWMIDSVPAHTSDYYPMSLATLLPWLAFTLRTLFHLRTFAPAVPLVCKAFPPWFLLFL